MTIGRFSRPALGAAAMLLLASAPAAGSDASPSGSEASTQLRFVIPSSAGRDAGFAAVIAAYEAADPHVDVVLESVPFSDYYTLLDVQWAGDSPPDVVLADSPFVKNYAYNGVLSPLDDIYTDADRDDFVPSIVAESTFDGQLYGGPFFETTFALYYNQDMFEAAGIDPPTRLEDAWTWDEFVTNLHTVVDAQDSDQTVWGVVFGGNPPRFTYDAFQWIKSNGDPGSPTMQSISDDGTSVTGYLDTPEALEAFQRYQDLFVTEGLAPTSEVPDALGTGLAATMVSFGARGARLDADFPDLNWGVTPMPYMKTPVATTGNFTLGVSAKSPQQEAAKAFVQFATSEEGFMAYRSAATDLPARRSLLTTLPEFQEGPQSIFAQQLLHWGQPRAATPGFGAFDQIVGTMLADIALGADVEDTVRAGTEQLDRQLQQYAP